MKRNNKKNKETEEEKEIKEIEISESQKNKAIEFSKYLQKFYSEENIDKIGKKIKKYLNKENLKKIWDKIEFMWQKLISKETPLKVKLAIFGGLLYLILPFDVFPDGIPGLGFADDVAVLVYIWKTVAPFIKDTAVEYIDEKITEKIKVTLSTTYKATVIRAGIILVLNILATLISCFLPFGEIPSKYVGSFIFVSTLIYSFYRMIRWVVKNGSMAFKISMQIIKKRSIRKGIADYVRSDDNKLFRQISKTFKIMDIANQMSDLDLPTLEDVIHTYVKRFLLSILLFFSLYFVYIILIYWVLKPFILMNYANISTFQLLVYPITHLILSFHS